MQGGGYWGEQSRVLHAGRLQGRKEGREEGKERRLEEETNQIREDKREGSDMERNDGVIGGVEERREEEK